MERITKDIYIGGVTTKATVKQKKIKYENSDVIQNE